QENGNVQENGNEHIMYTGDVQKLETIVNEINSENIYKKDIKFKWEIVSQSASQNTKEEGIEHVIEISSNGLLKAKNAGVAEIKRTDEFGNAEIFKIKVNPKIKDITIEPEEITLQIGDIYTVKPKIFPKVSSDEKFVWNLDNENAVSISDEGEIKALSYGVAKINFSCSGVVSNTLKVNVKAPVNERVNILMVGTSEYENIRNVNKQLFSPYISFEYVPAYKKSIETSDELLKVADLNFKSYDIVVFGRNGGHLQINESVENAKAAGKKIIVLDGDTPKYCSNNEIPKNIFENINKSYTKYVRDDDKISDMWAEKFLYELIDAYLPKKAEKIPNWKLDKIEVLYIGKCSENMEEAVDTFESQVYSGFSNWSFKQLTQVDKKINPNDYDVIICDNFSHDSNGKSDFVDLFGYDGSADYWKKWPNVNFIVIRQDDDIEERDNFKKYEKIENISIQPDLINETYEFYYYILNTAGNEMVRNWPFTNYLEEGFIKHLISGRVFKTVPEYLEWYESSEYYKEGAPYIGIFGFSVYAEEMKTLSELLDEKGYNIILGDGDSEGVYNDLDGYFINPETGKSYVSCFVSFKNWAVNYWNQKEGVRELKILNVPVIKGVGTYRSETGGTWGSIEIYDKNSGIPESTFAWIASASNVDGMTDFIALTPENIPWIAERAIAWAELNATENQDKDIAFVYYNYPPGKDDIGANYLNVIRSVAGDGAKDRVTAGDPEIPINDPEFKGLIRRMKEEGYQINIDKLPIATMVEGGSHVYDYSEKNESLILNEVNLIHLIYSQGINVGSYAPGVLDKMVLDYIEYHENIPEGHNPNGTDWWGCELIPVSDYVEWLNDEVYVNKTMDIKLLEEVTKTWGHLEDIQKGVPSEENDYFGGMIWRDKEGAVGEKDVSYFVIPMVKFGDVRLMPQPNRALASNKALDSSTYHGDISPTHQYLAFFMWLNRGTEKSTDSGNVTGIYDFHEKRVKDYGIDGKSWKADALIQFGTHGTHEWLPGTSVGLSRTKDWGPVLLPSLPNIYPYIVANVGEGLTAEYRGNALIISHLTPPMVKTQLYEELIEIEAAVIGYQKQQAMGGGDPAIIKAYREIVAEDIYKLGWQDSFKYVFDSFLTEDKAGVSDDPKVQEELIKKYLVENDDVFHMFQEDYLHTYIKAIKENSLSYGMHTYSTFDTSHIAPMVWNMWSRQGLDDVLLKTYFSGEGLTMIPTKNKLIVEGSNVSLGSELSFETKYDESDVLKFVEKVISYKDENGNYGDPGADEIREFLDSTFEKDAGNKEYQDEIIFFLLGPSGAFSDKGFSDPEEIVDYWKSKPIYEDFRENLFEFYWYQTVPRDLQGTPDKNLKELRAVDGTVLGDKELTDKMTRFVSQILLYENYENDPAAAVENCLALSGLGENNTTRPWYNEEIVFYVLGNNRIQYDENLRECGLSEEDAIMGALSAEFIEPSGGNDPVQRPEVMPTGRNFYGVDPATYPTPAAWKVGREIGKQMVTAYYEKNEEWPDTFSFMRFGVDFMRDEGTLEASLFWLLGCEPTWTTNGIFKGAVPVLESDPEKYDEMFKIRLKNGTEVYRPRIDVIYNSAGMRDGYGSMFRHIDRAVKAVSLLEDEENVSNNVKKNVKEIHDLLINAGLSENLASEFATSRVFAQELGNYEIGTGNLISSSGKMENAGENQEDVRAVADLYLGNMGFLYSENNWGDSSKEIQLVMKSMLGRADASVFSSSSDLYDSLDNDDVFQYFGVMNLASSMYDKEGNYIENRSEWKTPEMFIADTSNIDFYKEGDKLAYTASEFIQKNLNARYLNPKWVEGMKESGHSGASMFSEVFANLYGWSVASNGDLISDSTWNKVYDVYMEQSLVDWSGNVSPYALQSITSRMIEVNRTGYWNATDEQMKTLVETYVDSAVQTGVACCHHTCGNPTFDKFMQGIMSSPLLNDMPEEQKQKYWEAVYDATERDKPKIEQDKKPDSEEPSGRKTRNILPNLPIPTAPSTDENNTSLKISNDTNKTGEGVGKSGGKAGNTFVSGFQMIEKTISNTTAAIMDFLQNPTFSSSNMFVILAIILVVGVIFYGFKKRDV
ncbi:MAG: hypothetical protein GX362_00430, partial [Methanosarcinaceae archaeon]|nr:hypothetical protein [Methanosarcinaceae archaeon]